MKIKIIRFADEGFKNYKLKVKLNNKIEEIEGCYAFVRKIFKGALQYNISTTLKDRINDKKNTLILDENTKVYGRKLRVSNISLRGNKNCFLEFINGKVYEIKNYDFIEYKGKTVYTDYNVNWDFDNSFHLMTLREINQQLREYENFISNLKNNGYSVRKKDVTYLFYEIIVNTNFI